MNKLLNHSNVFLSNVSRETLDNINTIMLEKRDIFQALIEKWMDWNQTVNLFSRKITREKLETHIYHSLFLLPHSDTVYHDLVFDAGTGGGLPGIPLAIADPTKTYLLVDQSQKKQFVVKDIIRSLCLNNVKNLHTDITGFNTNDKTRIVTKHAFSIPFLISSFFGKNYSEIAALKGENVFDEINFEIAGNHLIYIQKINHPDNSFFENKYLVTIRKLPGKKR